VKAEDVNEHRARDLDLVVVRRSSRTGYHYVAVPNGRRIQHRRYTLWRIEESLAPSSRHDTQRNGFIFGDGKVLVMGVGLTLRTCREIIRNQRK
jgi:hypothetical protein